jgi:repressor LexA
MLRRFGMKPISSTDLTETQRRVLAYLHREIRSTGRTPSLRKAAGDLGISHAAVGRLIKALETKGYLRREGRYSRVLHILNRADETAGLHRFREVAVIGRITAGLPMYAQQEWAGTVVVDAEIYRGRDLFSLRIRGDSMRGAGIFDGDIAVCEPRQFAENGEIVVALIHGDEATVKRFFRRGDHIELRPENAAYQPTRYAFDEILIQGKVVGVVRGPKGIPHRPV